MEKGIKQALAHIKTNLPHPIIFLLSLVLSLVSCLYWLLHYSNVYYGNNTSWITWLLAVTTLLYSVYPQKIKRARAKSPALIILVSVLFLYLLSHLWNFSTAPWNQNGLFDDAAWDIYFAKNHVLNNQPIQPAYFDNVGYISREVVFHYYISVFFIVFGYNLLIFNISLLVLGFITVLFTTLIIHELFKNPLVTALSALIVNFFPLHYTQIFMGHRYAIVAPLMVVSLYYLYTAFSNRSNIRAVLSGIFAALCFGSGIMGRQYLYGLALSTVVVCFTTKFFKRKDWISISVIWLASFVVSATPLLIYILFHYSQYSNREQGLLMEFTTTYRNGGLIALKPYIINLTDIFFAPQTYRRFFMDDYYAIPLPYYLLLLPGLAIVVLKKHFEIFFLSVIPVIAAFLSGAYDFRILLATPIWVITIAFGANFILTSTSRTNLVVSALGKVFVGLMIGTGFLSSTVYLWSISKDPNHIRLLPHNDVAVSRLIQDIVIGTPNPSPNMKWNEFDRKADMLLVPFDTLVSPKSAYAVAHLYLQNYNDTKILSFINQGTQLLETPERIYDINVQAIKDYESRGKDLKLVWEVTDKTDKIVNMFRKYKDYGVESFYSGEVDSNKFSLYVLTIYNKNIQQFKQGVARETYNNI